jgi:excisionase family DNA binding protein
MSQDDQAAPALRRPPVGYTVEEVQQMLRVSRNAAYQMVARGEIPSIKIGRLVRIPYAPFHKKFGDCIPA